MKTITSALLLLFIGAPAVNSQQGWFIQPSFTSYNLYDCKASALYPLYIASDFGTIFRSSNNGLNWAIYNFNDPLLSGSSFRYVLGGSNDNWTAVGQGNAYAYSYGSTDSVYRIGVSPQLTLKALSSVSGYFFYSATIAAGQGGNFYIQDASNQWQWRKDVTATNKAAGRSINYSWGTLFVGDNGLIMKADSIGLNNNGESIAWRVRPSGTSENLNCIMGGGLKYMAVGNNGTILLSNDLGETWSKIESPTTEDLYGVWLGYAYLICGSNGTILRCYSQNFDKWYPQISPTTDDLYFIMSLGYYEYIAGGMNGRFIRTTDGGGSLKRVITNSTIQGFWNPATDLMVTDTLTATVRSSVSPYGIISSGKDLSSNYGGSIITVGPTVLNSVPYYIQMNHRNSIETWSKTTLTFSNNDLYYDFHTSANRAYGDNQIQVDASPVRFAFYGGDVNQDGTVEITDIVEVFNDGNNFVSGYVNTDVDGNNFVDLSDLTLTLNNSNSFISRVTP